MSTPASVLRDAFERHTWATLRLLDHLEALDAGTITEGVPGTYGPILETLSHLVNADGRYLERLEHPVLPDYEPGPPEPIGELRTRVQALASRWEAALGRLESGTLVARIDRSATDGWVVDPAETLLLLQALHHGDDHRAQVCSTLGALGLEVPDLDVWSFWEDRRS
jgi:uncharacterized damage-inducible protein DinB